MATLTVTLPANATSVTGQKVVVACTQIVTTLTINGAGTILSNPTAFAANDCFQFVKTANNKWARIL